MPRLVYPRRLTARQRELADRYLEPVPEQDRQSLLDELEGRFRAEQRGARPVYDELRYLHRLCARVKAGRFQPNLGLKVEEERRARREEAERRLAARQARQREQPSRDPGEVSDLDRRFAALRKSLGRSPKPPEKETAS